MLTHGSGFKDHFSGHAKQYARYRPAYPAALYDWLAVQAPARICAWDVATGNGQAAVEIARRFKRVIATDGSHQQIEHATPAPNIEYRVETAEANTLADHSRDLRLELNWTLQDLLGYLRTWSAVQRYQSVCSIDPVSAWEPEFTRAWGNVSHHIVHWPMRVRAFRIHPE